jgi:hypothetical protein
MSGDFCQKVGNSDVCEKRQLGGSSYTYVMGGSNQKQKANQVSPIVRQSPVPKVNKEIAQITNSERDSRFPVEARRSKGGARLALIRRLITHRDKGVPYAAINAYFRKEFDDIGATDSMMSGFIVDILTYDPRNETAKDYSEVLAALNSSSANLDWLQFWDIIDGLEWD